MSAPTDGRGGPITLGGVRYWLRWRSIQHGRRQDALLRPRQPRRDGGEWTLAGWYERHGLAAARQFRVRDAGGQPIGDEAGRVRGRAQARAAIVAHLRALARGRASGGAVLAAPGEPTG